ncbi:hypothetical protein WJX77_004733 [Trebouxia sp. C0004]
MGTSPGSPQSSGSPQGSDPGTSGSDATPAGQSTNVDLSGEWYTELPPPKKARLQLQQRQIYLFERGLDKQDLIIVKLDKLIALTGTQKASDAGWSSKVQKNQHRDMAIAFMQKRMIIDGFYPTSDMWTRCALNVLGKDSLVDAKKDMSKYLAVLNMAQDATNNKNQTVCDQYRNGGDDLGDFFKVESVIIYATGSLTKSELLQLDQVIAAQRRFSPKIWSCISGSHCTLPTTGADLEADEFRSDFVTVKKLSS